MKTVLFIHILGGTIGLLTGYVALYSVKGGEAHRKSGTVFVCAMLAMSLIGALIAALTNVHTSVIMGVFTAYLVTTSLTTVRPVKSYWLDMSTMVVGMAVGITFLSVGLDVVARGESQRGGMPAPMFFVFASISLLASLSDIRVLRSTKLTGAKRLARHLWRMCFALFIASASFFLGQSDKFPEALRVFPVLVSLSLAPLAILLYWLWRVRFRRHRKPLSPEVNDNHSGCLTYDKSHH